MSLLLSFNLILVIVAIYIYQIRFCYVDCSQIDLDSIKFRTGDLILFKAQNNPNDILIGSYYTHIGICFGNLIFEANGIEGMNLKPWHAKNGIFVSDARSRVSKYKGKCYYKPYFGKITRAHEKKLLDFIIFAKTNFYYDNKLFISAFNKKFNFGTNCGELVYLAMITLGILPEPDAKPFHCLRYIANFDGAAYPNLFEIATCPF